jgi:hypothetical protein
MATIDVCASELDSIGAAIALAGEVGRPAPSDWRRRRRPPGGRGRGLVRAESMGRFWPTAEAPGDRNVAIGIVSSATARRAKHSSAALSTRAC